MQKLVILAVLVAGLLLTFPMQSGAAPTCVDIDTTGERPQGGICVVNVTGHGSVTDCNASDEAFTTIQDAIQFLIATEEKEPIPGQYPPTGFKSRTILVCPGTYDTTPDGGVNIPINALTIVSTHGPWVTRISGPFHYGFIINAHTVTIEGFTVVGGDPGTGNANIGIFIYGGHGNRVLGNVVRDALTLGICIGTSNNIVGGNIVHDNRDGIALGNVGCENAASDVENNDNIITNNTVRHNDRYGIVVWSNAAVGSTLGRTGNSVVGNTVHNNGTGIAISPKPDATLVAQRTTVDANSVHDNITGILDQGVFTRCDGNNVRHNHVNFDDPMAQGACASKDNQLPYSSRNPR